MSEPQAKTPDLGTRMFNGPFAIAWALFLFLLFGFGGVPLANALVVCWVRGTDAYQGIRVLKGRPLKFSDGLSVPGLAEAVAGFGVFVVIVFGPPQIPFAHALFRAMGYLNPVSHGP